MAWAEKWLEEDEGRGGTREEDDLGRKTASGGPEAENAPGGGRGKGQGRAGWPPPAGRRLADAMRKLAEGAAADASFKASFGCNTITKTIALVSVQSGKVALVKLQTYEGAAYVGTLDDTPSRPPWRDSRKSLRGRGNGTAAERGGFAQHWHRASPPQEGAGCRHVGE